ncbi:MAG: hypothetical protein JW791_01030 [Nanoarchaeota archaeon]|nr:hypothetical protein [Nanoarchaeota archaeon]
MRSAPNSTIKMIMKELGMAKGAGYGALDIKGNIAVEQLVKIADAKMKDMSAYTLKNAVKTAAGACVPIGVIVEGMIPKDFARKVDEGAYDKEINGKITTVSEDKKKLLAKQLKEWQAKVAPDFEEVKKKLEAKAQKEAMKEAKAASGAALAAKK